MSWGDAWGTSTWGGGADVTDAPAAGPITLSANTVHITCHVVAATAPLNVLAGTQHETMHVVAATGFTAKDAGTQHAVVHVVAANPPLLAGTVHATVHIVSATGPLTLSANTQALRVHVVAAALPTNIVAGTQHTTLHVITAIGVSRIAGTPMVVVLDHNTTPIDPYNPTFVIAVGTTPVIRVALVDGANNVVPVPGLTGATVTFSLYDLGGVVIFTRAATVDDISTGKVHYQVQAGDALAAGHKLGKFHVTYPNAFVQHFPNDRYMDVLVS